MEKKYFKVVAKCGHVGKKKYVPIQFAVKAFDGKEAAKKARNFKRVKHHHKDAILQCKEVDYEEFLAIYNANEDDPYLKCQNKQDQRRIDIYARIQEEPQSESFADKEKRKKKIAYKEKKYKILERLWRKDYHHEDYY